MGGKRGRVMGEKRWRVMSGEGYRVMVHYVYCVELIVSNYNGWL